MLRDKISLKEILIGFESALKIEYREPDVEKIAKEAKQRLEAAFGVRLSGNIYEDQIQNQLVGDSIDILLSQLVESLKSLSLLLSISMFDKVYGENLRDLNCLGFAEQKLKVALKYLQDEVLYSKRDTFFDQIVESVSRIDICETKRLLVIMIVMERLGISEGVALIAQYLYLGMR
jgi:hypothetical protein